MRKPVMIVTGFFCAVLFRLLLIDRVAIDGHAVGA
jgi:hypothetical protein